LRAKICVCDIRKETGSNTGEKEVFTKACFDLGNVISLGLLCSQSQALGPGLWRKSRRAAQSHQVTLRGISVCIDCREAMGIAVCVLVRFQIQYKLVF